MGKCSCIKLGDFYEPHPDEEYQRISSTFHKVKSYEDVWLAKCSICEQYWVVNSVSRGPLVVKASKDINIKEFEEIRYRKLCYLQFNGGESNKACLYAKCDNRAVKNMAICVDHALDG